MNVLYLNKKFYKRFKGKKGIIGVTEKSQPIYFYGVEKTDYPKIIVQSAIHAREYISAYLTLKLIKRAKKVLQKGSVYFVPILNPDGVKIALNENPLYKANARGVDLNVNFDARWGTGEKNVRESASENYIGEYPFSERETRAIRDFTLSIKPNFTLSYHSKGEEIYYEFFQDGLEKERDEKLAKIVASCTGYKIKPTLNSAGGYKDWCIEKLKIPALTIEVGNDDLSHPIGKRRLGEIYRKNKLVIEKSVDYFLEK